MASRQTKRLHAHMPMETTCRHIAVVALHLGVTAWGKRGQPFEDMQEYGCPRLITLREERVEKPADVGNVWTESWLAWVQSTDALSDHTRWVMDQLLEDLEQTFQRVRTVEKRMEDATADAPIVQNCGKLKESVWSRLL